MWSFRPGDAWQSLINGTANAVRHRPGLTTRLVEGINRGGPALRMDVVAQDVHDGQVARAMPCW
jgi:hypothetical protein